MMPEKGSKNPFSENFLKSSVAKILKEAIIAGNGGAINGSLPALNKNDLNGIAGSDLRIAIEETIMTPKPDVALAYLKMMGFLALCLPEVDILASFDSETDDHKNLWEHTITVVSQIPPVPHLRWAALLHDIGKPQTKKTNDRGEIHFIGHEKAGARLAVKIFKRLDFPSPSAQKIKMLILHHLRCSQYEPQWTDSAVRRLSRRVGDLFEDLLILSRADITTSRKSRRIAYQKLLNELDRRMKKIKEEDSRLPLLPSGIGNYIMQNFSLPQGPQIGAIRKKLENLIMEGKLEARQVPEYYINYLLSNPDIIKKSG